MKTDQAGVTLIEVLAAIFVGAVGLLALLTLFPLGALEMAQAVKDDRTASVAADAQAFGEAGTQLVSRTTELVFVSLSSGSVDPRQVAELRAGYADLGGQASDLETRLEALRSVFPHRQIGRHLGPLLAQIRTIQHRIDTVVRLLSLVADDDE